ncbi:GNAT family N-acetyltransferase [Micromonospora sp. NPDC048905]|uniref:GNAT family N-acetyltransferase n=1 Tax=Micromonospora sp. NPDC048905 TaxID=3155494 RepID=UPI0033E43329
MLCEQKASQFGLVSQALKRRLASTLGLLPGQPPHQRKVRGPAAVLQCPQHARPPARIRVAGLAVGVGAALVAKLVPHGRGASCPFEFTSRGLHHPYKIPLSASLRIVGDLYAVLEKDTTGESSRGVIDGADPLPDAVAPVPGCRVTCASTISSAVDPTGSPLLLTGEEVVLREWADSDLPYLRGLFDAADVAANTDIPSPFDADAFLARIRRRRTQRIVDLAVTRDGGEPLGLVALHVAGGVLGYAVGPAHRGQGLASRSLRRMTEFCHEDLGLSRLRLAIVRSNVPSQGVARSAGYVRGDDALVERVNGLGESKLLETWWWTAPGATGR